MFDDEPGDWLTTNQAAALISRLCPGKPISARAFQKLIYAERQRDIARQPRLHFQPGELMLWDPDNNPRTSRWFAYGDAVERFARRRCEDLPGLESTSLSLREAGARAGVSHETIRKAILRGELPAARDGRRLSIEVNDLDAWAAQQRGES